MNSYAQLITPACLLDLDKFRRNCQRMQAVADSEQLTLRPHVKTLKSLQAAEYYGAYELYGLTLNSGIYGSTFFMLTGFHGFHVAMGMTMLLIQLVRSVRREHFTATDHFGFEASSWYWHFVDVVWVFLFLFVYIL